MEIGILEDFTHDMDLDYQLLDTPKSGIYVNSGVHPSVTVHNLLEFLPNHFGGIKPWSNEKTYGIFEKSRKRSDLVLSRGSIYQSLMDSNLDNNPVEETKFWLRTNLESLMLKKMLFDTMERVKSELSLTKRLVNSQMIYEVGRNEITLPNDYAAWIFEPKGSDYLSFTINRISIQKKGTSPINLYVVNQGVIVDTLIIIPNDGKLEFKELGYTFAGKGEWFFIIDSTEVLTDSGHLDPLAYDGFVCRTATGIGESPETATFNDGSMGNGLGFDITVSLDPEVYLSNNLGHFGSFLRSAFEYLALQIYLHNPNNVSNRTQRIQMSEELLIAEIKSMEGDTVAKRFHSEKKKAISKLEKTFDTQLNDTNEFEVTYTSL